jgi:uncharacterized protein with FMN-binding domain
MKKVIFIIIIGIVVIAIGILSSWMLCNTAEMKRVRAMPINEIDLSNISDGSYKGDYSYGGFTYEVEVMVKEHKIETINVLKNRDTSHAKNAEGVIDKVIKTQTVNVDAVSGATTTS